MVAILKPVAEVLSDEETTELRSSARRVSAVSGVNGGDALPHFIEQLVEKIHPSVPESTAVALESTLLRYEDVFSKSEVDLGLTDLVAHQIDKGLAVPLSQQLRRFPPAHVQAISEHVDNMLAQGVIEPACSPWASNVVLVRKKDNLFRCCVDYRKLNLVTRKDA